LAFNAVGNRTLPQTPTAASRDTSGMNFRPALPEKPKSKQVFKAKFKFQQTNILKK